PRRLARVRRVDRAGQGRALHLDRRDARGPVRPREEVPLGDEGMIEEGGHACQPSRLLAPPPRSAGSSRGQLCCRPTTVAGGSAQPALCPCPRACPLLALPPSPASAASAHTRASLGAALRRRSDEARDPMCRVIVDVASPPCPRQGPRSTPTAPE